MTGEDLEVKDTAGEGGIENDVRLENRKNKRKQRLMEEAAKAGKRGICYLSRVPPHMTPVKLRQILSQYGEIQRIYLVPEDPAAQMNRKRAGGFRGQEFSEGWVEFTKKSIAKRVAKMLNGQQLGGRKRSSFYYDIWNIKYLSKFKWDDLTEEIAYNNAVREQKLALEVSVAKKERDFFIKQVDKSRALSAIEERLKKKQKVQQESIETSSTVDNHHMPKLIRQVQQKKAVAAGAGESKTKLSKDTLAAVIPLALSFFPPSVYIYNHSYLNEHSVACFRCLVAHHDCIFGRWMCCFPLLHACLFLELFLLSFVLH